MKGSIDGPHATAHTEDKPVRFLIIRKADEETEAGAKPTQALFDAMMKYNEELMNAGVMQAGHGLKPSAQGARVVFRGGSPKVVDGPFAEAKELIAGFSVFEVASKEEAIEWVKRWPREDGDVTIEIRPFYEAEDFGEAFTDGVRRQEERLRAQSTGL